MVIGYLFNFIIHVFYTVKAESRSSAQSTDNASNIIRTIMKCWGPHYYNHKESIQRFYTVHCSFIHSTRILYTFVQVKKCVIKGREQATISMDKQTESKLRVSSSLFISLICYYCVLKANSCVVCTCVCVSYLSCFVVKPLLIHLLLCTLNGCNTVTLKCLIID